MGILLFAYCDYFCFCGLESTVYLFSVLNMKKFIQYLILFSLPLLVMSYFIDVFISMNLKKSNSFAQKEYSTWNAIIDGKVNSDILIYGSSRAWVHFNSTMMSDSLKITTYNLGIDGHNFWLQYLRHKMVLDRNTKPKVIIVSVDMFTLQKVENLYNLEQFLPYMLWNNQIKNATSSYEGFEFADYQFPLIRYYGKKKEIETAIRYYSGHLSNPVCRVKGYQGLNRVWNADFNKAKSSMKGYKVKIDSETVLLFQRFLSECKQNNIKLIFVYAPEYIEGQSFTINRNQIFSIFKKYSKRYNIPFYDYSNDSICLQKKYFYNSVHLNKTGAELFSAKFIDTLKTSRILKNLNN